jgi:uncharacterized coiled-coil DUF342 family protein
LYSGFIDYIQKVEDLIYKHFEFLFSEQPLRESVEDEFAHFDKAVIEFRKEYINLANIRYAEKELIDKAKNTGIINPIRANNNVNQINLHLRALASAGDVVGKEMISIYNDINEISKSIDELHNSLPKNPPAPIKFISMLKNKFKEGG